MLEENCQPKIIYIRYSSKMEVKEKYLYKKCLLSVYYVSGIVLRVQQWIRQSSCSDRVLKSEYKQNNKWNMSGDISVAPPWKN